MRHIHEIDSCRKVRKSEQVDSQAGIHIFSPIVDYLHDLLFGNGPFGSRLMQFGNFESVDCQIAGLGEIDAIQQIYAAHTKAAIDSLGDIATTASADSDVLADGTYSAKFDTDSSMFHVNEANDKKGELTVKDGKMTIHVSLVSKKIVNLFAGTAEDAQKDGAEIIEPTTDTVKYSDGYTEEVYGFDIPVPAIGEEFNVAILGEKGKWYDHKVSVKNPVKTSDDKKSEGKKTEELKLADGTYETDVTLTGGTGRASVESPAKVEIKDKEATATIIWSSPNYDYMIVDGEKYEPVNKDGNSTFEIPVTVFDTEMEVTADTVAMSTPHEIDYTLNFDSSSMKKEEK